MGLHAFPQPDEQIAILGFKAAEVWGFVPGIAESFARYIVFAAGWPRSLRI